MPINNMSDAIGFLTNCHQYNNIDLKPMWKQNKVFWSFFMSTKIDYLTLKRWVNIFVLIKKKCKTFLNVKNNKTEKKNNLKIGN